MILLFYRFILNELTTEQLEHVKKTSSRENWCSKRHHQRLKSITKGKLERLLENFIAIFAVLSYIILGKTEDSGNFRNSHSIKSSLRPKKKKVPRTSRVNKRLGYFELISSARASKTETTKIEKRKLNIALEFLNTMSVEFQGIYS